MLAEVEQLLAYCWRQRRLTGLLGKALPYGIYDVGRNAGWVTVGRRRARVALKRA